MSHDDNKTTGFGFEGPGTSVSALNPYGRHPSQPPLGHVIDMGPFANIKQAHASSSPSRGGFSSASLPDVNDFEEMPPGDGTTEAVVETDRPSNAHQKRFYPQGNTAEIEPARSMFEEELDDGARKLANVLPTPIASAMGSGNEKGLILTGTPPYDLADTGPPAVQPPSVPPKMTPGTARVVEHLLKNRERQALQVPKPTLNVPDPDDVGSSKERPSRAGTGSSSSSSSSTRSDANVSNMPKLGMAQFLKMAGVPDEITSMDSELVAGVMEKHAAIVEAPDASALYLGRDEVHPVALNWFLGGRYGVEWLDWEMETIAKTIKDDTGIDLTGVVLNKIAALKLSMNKPQLIRDEWTVFEKVCVAFDGDLPRVTIVEDLSPETMTFGVLCLQTLQPDWEPSPELATYMAARLFDAGFIVPPPALGLVDENLQKLGSVDQTLRKAVLMKYARYLQGHDFSGAGEDAVNIQVVRLLRCNAYAIDKADDLIRQLS